MNRFHLYRQRQRARRCELHARRPAAGAELDPAGPGRQSRPAATRCTPPTPSSMASSPPTRRSIPRRLPPATRPASPVDSLAPTANWQATVANGVAANAGNIELWDFPGIEPASPACRASQVQAPGRDPCRRQPAADSGRAGRRLGAGLHRARLRDRRPRHGRLFGHRCGAARERRRRRPPTASR